MVDYSLSDRAYAFFEKHRVVAGILAVAAIAGVLTIAIAAPNAIQIFSPRRGVFPLKNKNWKMTLRRMEQHRYLKLKHQKSNALTYTLTERGIQRLLTIEPPSAPPLRTWDKKWRLIIFDIKEKHRDLRNTLRRQLRSLGFQPLQQSVWISPYPVHKDFLKLLRMGISAQTMQLHYLHVHRFENDTALLRRFTKHDGRHVW